MTAKTAPQVLVVVAPGAEEIETLTVADVLVRAGCDVTMASNEGPVVTGSRGLPLAAHTRLADVAARAFDCVYLPGGFGSAEYCRDTAIVQDLAEAQLASGRLLAVICACPLALLPRGLAKDRRITCYPALREQFEGSVGEWVDEAVVIDDNLVTSQGPATAMRLGLTLAQLLVDDATAAKVAADMLAPELIAS